MLCLHIFPKGRLKGEPGPSTASKEALGKKNPDMAPGAPQGPLLGTRDLPSPRGNWSSQFQLPK